MSSSTATVLFTDLVASTRLSIEFGARYDEARRAHDSLLRSAVEAHRGRVIKGLGDGVMATFDAAVDAVAAARAAQQSIHRLNQQGREPELSIRAGLSVGDVSFEGDDCFGAAVIESARLCSVAEGDQILASDVVRAVAGGRGAAGFADIGAIELKGIPGPFSVVEVLWERLVRSTIPLPARLGGEQPAFVGRTNEIDELNRAFTAVSEGGARQVVLVGGEPGLGKTALVSQAARAWHDAGATIAMGWCEADVRAPYRPFIDALGQLVSSAPTEVLHAHVERHGAGVFPLAPGLGRRIDQPPEVITTDPETERFLLFSAVADLLAALSEQAPLVLFLDDLHWADAGTASLLRSLATTPDPARLLVVGTFRIDELSAEHPMGQALAAFHRVPTVSRLHLDGLRSADILELVEQLTGAGGGRVAEQLADDLVAETGGNPFFVTEVIRYLAESDQLSELSGDGTASLGASLMPDSIREVLGERVARLGPVADDVLAVAAVIGSEFTLPLLAAVTGLDESKLLAILTEAATAALVREVSDTSGRFAFTHALVQHAILVNLGATREAALHRRVAEALEAGDERGVPVGELAHHWLRATNVSDNSRARDWALQAGDAALASLAPGDAVTYFRQALLLHDQLRDDDMAMRIDLLTKLGEAERQSGDPEHRDTLLKACRLARRLDDGSRLATAALANNSGSFSSFQAVDTERVKMLEAAIDADRDHARRAVLLGTLAIELTYSGDFARRSQLVDDALHAARTSGDKAVLLRVLNLAFSALWIPETLAERMALTEESLSLAAEVDDPLLRYWAAISNYHNLVQSGRVEQSEELLRDVSDLSDRLAQPALQWRTRHIQATRLLLFGDPDAAEPLAREALRLGDGAGEPEAVVYFKSQQVGIHWQRGTMPELSARIKGTPPRSVNAAGALCLIFAEAGRAEEARALLDHEVGVRFAGLPHDPAFLTTLASFAEGAILLGHSEAAGQLHDLISPYAAQLGFDGVVSVGWFEHYIGALAIELGDYDDAIERLERSCAVHEAIPAPFFEARSRHQLARARHLRSRPGDEPAARAEVLRAIHLAETHGYRMVHRRADELLTSMNGD